MVIAGLGSGIANAVQRCVVTPLYSSRVALHVKEGGSVSRPDRISRRQFVQLASLAAITGSALVACGGSTQTPTSAAASQADRAADQSMRIVGAPIPPGLQPAKASGSDLDAMTQMTFMPPFILDKDGKMQPGVCTKWDVSADGLKYTLKVDPRAKFSDGSKVTAADIKFSWEYLTYPEAKAWSPPFLTAPIAGYQDVLDGKSKDMQGMVARDDETLEINLAKPYTPFVKSLPCFFAGVIKKDYVLKSGADWELKPVNVGPYKLVSWNQATGDIEWAPNEYWWGDKPIIQKVTYRAVKDPNTRSIMYDNNEMDIMMVYDSALIAAMKAGTKADQLHLIPTGGGVFYVLRTKHAPLDDVNFRRALLKATDTKKVITSVMQGAVTPSYGILSPNLEGYANPQPYYDPEGAKQALAASKYQTAANVPPITLAVPTNQMDYIRISEANAQIWKDVLGIDVAIKTYTQGTDPAREAAQVWRASLGTVILDPGALVEGMGLSTSALVKSRTEHTNPQLDDIISQLNTMPLSKQSERITLAQQADTMIMDQAYYIPLTQVEYYFAAKPWLKNYASNNDYSLYNLPQMYIAQH
jgi:peptide/nickel transport system substrate-binding protein